MRVVLIPQRRIVDLPGRRRVSEVLAALGITPGTVMVIRGETLLTDGDFVEGDHEIEIRSVISGGAPVGTESRDGDEV